MRALLIAGLAILVTCLPAARGDGRCTLGPGVAYRSETTALLLAIAMPDTVESGPGSIVSSGYPGHSGPGGTGAIYGQVMHAVRVGGADSTRVAAALERNGARRVIVVPWDYDMSCKPTRWSAGFAWVTPGDTGTYTLSLRPEELWVNGIPVFDASAAEFEPYPLARWFTDPNRPYQPLPPRPWLTAGEYFDLLLARPAEERLRQNPDSAWRAFLTWKQANGHLLERFPGTDLDAHITAAVRSSRWNAMIDALEPMMAGTWRFRWALLGLPPQGEIPAVRASIRDSLFARTSGRITDVWLPRGENAVFDDDPTADIAPPDAYTVWASTAPTLDGLGGRCSRWVLGSTAPEDMRTGGYTYAIDPPDDVVRTEWRGWIETKLLSLHFAAYPALFDFHRKSFEEWSAAHVPGRRHAPATFRLGADGMLRVEQVIRVDDGRELRLDGERISREVLDC